METLLFKISGLKDETCVRTLANAIQDLPNIGHIEISLEKGEASIEHGRFVSPDDIQAVAGDVLRHRLILSFEAEANGVTPDKVIEELLAIVPVG